MKKILKDKKIEKNWNKWIKIEKLKKNWIKSRPVNTLVAILIFLVKFAKWYFGLEHFFCIDFWAV